MLTDQGNIVISKTPASAAEDYELLRKTGLSYIQQFSGKVWTDFNLHDPGITIHELLCYALTDLVYRTSFPVADLLTPEQGKGPNPNDFYTAKDILTSHPVTVNDYRKFILDAIPGVRNVWLETLDDTNYDPALYFDQSIVKTSLVLPPASHLYQMLQLKGLYVVKLEAEDYATIHTQQSDFLKTLAKYRDKNSSHNEVEAQPDEYKFCLVNYAKYLLLDKRNLCEDFELIKVADEEWVAVCADIELQPDANADAVFLKINSVLYNYINPSLQFHSFKDLIDKGKRTEDIFNGPIASRGFIDDDELNQHGHKEVLYVSDIINELMDIPGILQIKSIHLSSYKKQTDGTYTILEDAQTYCLHLHDTANSVFQFMLDAAEQDKTKLFNHIRFSKGLIYFPPKRKPEYATYNFIDFPSLPANFENDLPIPSGRNRNLLNYYSVQNDFPLCYYTGMDGIPNSETNLRKVQRLHLKAFLLFFDQLLADYLKQLDNLKNIFTWNGGVAAHTLIPFPLQQTQIRDLRKLLASEHKEDENISDNDFFHTTYNTYSSILETDDQQKQRRNRALDHLLARFNELFVDYTVFKFQQNQQGDFFADPATDEVINDKINFLSAYPAISSQRSHAFNYTKDLYATDNICGLQFRVEKMLGIADAFNRPLVTPLNNIDYKTLLQQMASGQAPTPADKLQIADNRFDAFDKTFGLHVLEHILLRPLYKQPFAPLDKLLPLCGDGTNNVHADCLSPDNYSLQISVVGPGWLSISNNMDFRAFTESLIRTEAPAHVAIKICWLDPARMFLFEKTTEAFFKQMAKIKDPGAELTSQEISDFNSALEDVYTMMGLLQNMYLPAKLDECENINYNEDTDKIQVPVILDHSALGSDGSDEWFEFIKPENESTPSFSSEARDTGSTDADAETTTDTENGPIAESGTAVTGESPAKKKGARKQPAKKQPPKKKK